MKLRCLVQEVRALLFEHEVSPCIGGGSVDDEGNYSPDTYGVNMWDVGEIDCTDAKREYYNQYAYQGGSGYGRYQDRSGRRKSYGTHYNSYEDWANRAKQPGWISDNQKKYDARFGPGSYVKSAQFERDCVRLKITGEEYKAALLSRLEKERAATVQTPAGKTTISSTNDEKISVLDRANKRRSDPAFEKAIEKYRKNDEPDENEKKAVRHALYKLGMKNEANLFR